jgi:hypothetical protein
LTAEYEVGGCEVDDDEVDVENLGIDAPERPDQIPSSWVYPKDLSPSCQKYFLRLRCSYPEYGTKTHICTAELSNGAFCMDTVKLQTATSQGAWYKIST